MVLVPRFGVGTRNDGHRPAKDKTMSHTRREFIASVASTAGGLLAARTLPAAASAAPEFKLRYLLGSCLYGCLPLATIVPEVTKTGAAALDIWPKVHGNQREQLDEMGEAKFAALLRQHKVQLGCITQYKLGPFHLQDEMRLAARLGCHTIVTGGDGPKGLKGAELKAAVRTFVEKLKPHLDVAGPLGITVAIENHGKNLIEAPDALKWLVEFRPSKHLGVALAPYHLPQDEKLLAGLIRALGDGIAVFYAWQHGAGCLAKLPKEQELLQMPGRGPLDFRPLLAALGDIRFQGWTEIFMHPVPRGVPILDTAPAVTAEINRGREYLTKCLAAL
jgi:sugar phosphate isomerase/epimerase